MKSNGGSWTLSVALVFLPLLIPMRAGAAGNDIRWNDCSPAGTHGLLTPCQSNQARSFVVGIVPPPGADHVTGFSAQITLDAGEGLPPFWEVWPGGCGDGRVLGNFDFTVAPTSCEDPWQGNLSGTLEISLWQQGGPVRLHLSGTLPEGQEVAMGPQTEYSLCRVTIRMIPMNCAGCGAPACFVLDNVCLAQGSGAPPLCQGYREVGTPWITWQQQDEAGCWLPVPTRRSTWGSLKSLYR